MTMTDEQHDTANPEITGEIDDLCSEISDLIDSVARLAAAVARVKQRRREV